MIIRLLRLIMQAVRTVVNLFCFLVLIPLILLFAYAVGRGPRVARITREMLREQYGVHL